MQDGDGWYSSKRVVMFLMIFLFIGQYVYNIMSGKSASETLTNQLFYLICWVLSTVFGEKIAGIFNKSKPPTDAP